MRTSWLRRIALVLAAPLLALLFALAVTTVILAASGHAPWSVYQQMWDYGTQASSIVLTLNLSTTYYLAAVAAAVGFRMNLFNIGVDGQYRTAALVTAYVGASARSSPRSC
jgi:simple sugar transport system permease protein